MKSIYYSKTDFPNGFDAGLLLTSLMTNHGKNFQLGTSAESIGLTLDDTDNEPAIRVTCLAHFALTQVQRDTAVADANADSFFVNGDKQKRFLLELFYEVDQRLRILEAKPAITKLQFFNGVKNIYKNI